VKGADRFFKYIDFGAGIRINHVRINVVKSISWDNLKHSSDSGNNQKFAVSVAYMF
jgi:hypothetical protein